MDVSDLVPDVDATTDSTTVGTSGVISVGSSVVGGGTDSTTAGVRGGVVCIGSLVACIDSLVSVVCNADGGDTSIGVGSSIDSNDDVVATPFFRRINGRITLVEYRVSATPFRLTVLRLSNISCVFISQC